MGTEPAGRERGRIDLAHHLEAIRRGWRTRSRESQGYGEGPSMRNTLIATPHLREHLRQVEELLDQIRFDRSIDDAERRRQISEVLATANARTLSLHESRGASVETVVPTEAVVLRWPRWHRALVQTG